jgi:hypothetical protein
MIGFLKNRTPRFRVKSWNDFMERDDVASKRKAKISIPILIHPALQDLSTSSSRVAAGNSNLKFILINTATRKKGNAF